MLFLLAQASDEEPGIMDFLAVLFVIGVAIAIYFIFKFFWNFDPSKKRGTNGQDSGSYPAPSYQRGSRSKYPTLANERAKKMAALDSSLYSSEQAILKRYENNASVTYFANGYLNANYYDYLAKGIPHPYLPWRDSDHEFPLCYLTQKRIKKTGDVIYKIGYTTRSERIDKWYSQGFRQLVHFHNPQAETLEHYLIDHYIKEGLCPHPKGQELMPRGWDESLCEIAPVNTDGVIRKFNLVEFISLANAKLHLWETGEILPRTCSVQGCERPFYAKGWCNAHYNQSLKGDVGGPFLS
tara:strand:- start:85 stop:972 length:888 start_codon:yes stop_codon:yes gene_type:complete